MPYSVRTQSTFPFVSITKITEEGAPAGSVELDPPMATELIDFSYAPTDDKIAITYNMRREDTVGDTANPPPASEVVLISKGGQSIMFGGNTLAGPQLYQRAVPTYLKRPGNFPLPITTGVYYTLGATSPADEAFALVQSDTPKVVRVYEALDAPEWALIEDYTLSEDVARVEWLGNSTLGFGDYVLVHGQTQGWVIAPSNDTISQAAPGRPILAATVLSGALTTVEDTGSGLVVCTYLDGTVLSTLTLPGGVTGMKARFAGEVIVASGTTALCHSWAKVSGSWRLVATNGSGPYGDMDEPLVSLDSPASRVAVSGYNGATPQVTTLARTTVNFPIFNQTNPTTALTNIVCCDVSQDGQWLVLGNGTNAEIHQLVSGTWTLQQTLAYGFLCKFSPDGVYLVVGNGNSPATGQTGGVRIFKRSSGTYSQLVQMTGSTVAGFFSSGTDCCWSQDGLRILVQGGGAVTLAVITRTSDTSDSFSQSQITTPSSAVNGCAIANTGTGAYGYVYVGPVGNGNGKIIYRTASSGSTIVQTITLTTQIPQAVALSSDANYMAVLLDVAPFFRYYKRSGTTWSEITTGIPTISAAQNAIRFNSNGTRLIIGSKGSTSTATLYSKSGDALSAIVTTPTLSGFVNDIGMSADGSVSLAVTSGTPYAYIWGEYSTVAVPAYVTANTFTAWSRVTLETFRGGSYLDGRCADGTGFHFTASGVPAYEEETVIDFMTGYVVRDVTRMVGSPGSSATIYVVKYQGVWNVFSATPGSEGVNFTDLDGVFCSVFKLDESDPENPVMREVGYQVHDVGTELKHPQWGPLGTAFSYFAISDNPANETMGRYVFGVNDLLGLYLGGVIWSPDMLDSFIAWDSTEAHFVATYSRTDTTTNDVRLYDVIDTGQHFTEWDAQPVAFGPCDYSACNQVIVAHGGTPNPFTLYDVSITGEESGTLTVHPMDDFDWGHNTLIIDVKFEDCGNIAVLTPDEVVEVVAGGPEGAGDGYDDADSAPSNGSSISVTPNHTIHINSPSHGHTVTVGSGSGGGSGGGWSGGLTPIAYIPYVAIHVFHGY